MLSYRRKQQRVITGELGFEYEVEHARTAMKSRTIHDDPGKKLTLPEWSIDRAIMNDAVDISVLTSFEEVHVDGEPDLVVELIDLYLADVPQRLDEMRNALTFSDAESVRAVAHGLKGSSSSLGAGKLAMLCEELELSVTGPSLQGSNTFLTKVEQEYERVRLAFAAERRKRMG